jgi:hypothetical protein
MLQYHPFHDSFPCARTALVMITLAVMSRVHRPTCIQDDADGEDGARPVAAAQIVAMGTIMTTSTVRGAERSEVRMKRSRHGLLPVMVVNIATCSYGPCARV